MRVLLGSGWVEFDAPWAIDSDGSPVIAEGRYVHVLPGGGRTLGEWVSKRGGEAL